VRNLWITSEHAFATWIADLEACRARPEQLVELVAAIVAAGERHRVFLPVELPAIGYARARDGALVPRLAALWREHRVVDAFAFTDAAMAPGAPQSSTVEAELAWFDRDDRVVHGTTADPASILEALQPFPGSHDCFTVSRPPVRVTGPRVSYPDGGSGARPIRLRFALHSDIWMPFVFGSAHPLADHERHFDNRRLAREHTPRLNAFLVEVAGLVSRAGGTWEVDRDDTGSDAGRWVGSAGIDLDAESPPVFPPEAAYAPWY